MSEAQNSTATDPVESDFWRVVPSYPGFRVSRAGQLQTRYKLIGLGTGSGKGARVSVIEGPWRSLKPQRLPTGYRYIHRAFYEDGKRRRRILYIHNLVLEAFIGPRPVGMECLHGDGNPANNNLENLRWGTPLENAADSDQHGTRPRGERHGLTTLSEQQVITIYARLSIGEGSTALAREYRVSHATIYNIAHGKTWAHVTRLL